jgi:ATPase subunit of ABC transporter with duplicated ATPase domains
MVDKPLPSYFVPPAISELIAKNEEFRQAEKQKKLQEEKKMKKQEVTQKRFDKYFGDKFTQEEVRSAIQVLESRQNTLEQKSNSSTINLNYSTKISYKFCTFLKNVNKICKLRTWYILFFVFSENCFALPNNSNSCLTRLRK